MVVHFPFFLHICVCIYFFNFKTLYFPLFRSYYHTLFIFIVCIFYTYEFLDCVNFCLICTLEAHIILLSSSASQKLPNLTTDRPIHRTKRRLIAQVPVAN